MFEEKNETLELRRLQFAVDAVKRMRDRVCDRFALQVTLQIENIHPQLRQLGMLRLRDSPDEEMNLAGILREIGRDLLADEGVLQLRDFQTTVDRVVIGDGNEVHPLGP